MTPEESIAQLRVRYKVQRLKVLMKAQSVLSSKRGPMCKCGIEMSKHPTRLAYWCTICKIFERDIN